LSTKASAEGATRANSQNWKEKHCHQGSVCDPTLEIFDELHESNSVNPLEDSWDPENMHRVQSPGGEQSDKHSQSIDWSLFLIG